MLDLIRDGIQLLQVIYNLRKQLNGNQEACLLLCDRVRIFDSWLQEWAGKDRLPDNASQEMSIQSLLTLLTEIGEFVRKFTKQGGPVWGQAKRATKKVFFRQTVAESLNDFHKRIDQCASALNICLTMSAEDKRREEMVALRNELNAQSEDLMAELRELKSDPGKLKELLKGLREEVGEGNVAILREIKSLQQKMESQDPLSLRDLGGLEESLKASNEALAAKMDKHYEEVVRVKEEVMAVRQTGDVILEKVNEVNMMMMKLLEDQALTKAEEQYRAKLLKKLLIPSGKVRIVEGSVKLGAGGFGEVYVALYQNKQVAVKSFFSLRGSTTAMTQKKDIAAVENEVLLMGVYLGPHPAIVSCYGYFMDEHQNISMVLELAPYGCLSSLLEDHESFPILSFRLVLGWLNDAIGALCFIHEHEVKHRDVKADNLLVFHNLHVKLCDFGLAKQHSYEKKESTMIGGTSSFMAPEVIEGKGSSYASDVFAWAMTAMQMILRRVPDRSRRSLSSWMGEVMGSVREDQDSITLASSAEVASGFEKLLTQCLQSEPTNRPSASTVSDLAQDMLTKTGGDPRHKLSPGDKSYIESIVRTAEEKSSLVVSEVTSLSSPMKLEEAASSPSSSKEIASVKRKLSSLSHDEAIELLIVLGCSADLKELCKKSFESPEEVNGRYLNGVKKVEHLREIGDNNSREPKLNNVLRDLQRIQQEGVPLDLMQEIRVKLLLSMVKSSLQPMVESGEVSLLQELEALGSVAKIPAEDINRGFTADLSDEKWGKGLEGVTALHISAAKGDTQIVRLLLLHPEIAVDAMDSKYGYTPLHFASEKGHEEVVKILLADSRVDVNKEELYGETPLYWASENGRVEVIKILLADSRVDVNKQNRNGYTPLHWACEKGHVEVVKILLADSRVDVNKQNWNYYTPLHLACDNGHVEVVKLLLADSRVDVNKEQL
eukprot:scaffold1812_cov178-Ochromonas_danica.AAC.2